MNRQVPQPAGAGFGPVERRTSQLGFPIGPAPAPVQTAPSFSLDDLWRLLQKYKWILLASLAIGIAGGAIVSMITTPLYRGTATLEIGKESVQIVDVGNSQPVAMSDTQSLETQYGLLRSTSLAERVADGMKLVEDPRFAEPAAPGPARLDQAAARLQRDLKVEPVSNSRLVKISYDSPDPQLAERIPNAFADAFMSSTLERKYAANDYARDFLQKRIAQVKARLEDSERKLVAYAQQQNIVSVAAPAANGGSEAQASQSLDAASLAAANSELAVAQNARVAAEQRYRQAASGSATNEVLMNPTLQGIKSELAKLRADYQQKRISMKPDHPELVDLQASIKALEADLKREGGVIVSALRSEYQAAAAREAELRGRVNRLTGSVLDLRGRSIQYNILQREVDTNRSLYDALLQRYKEIGVAGGVGSNQVSVVDRAELPGGPYKPNLPLNLAIGLAIGLIGGVGSAIAIEFVNDTIKTPDDVREKLHLASLGVIPRKQGQQALAEELKDQGSPVSEAYFSLRTSLQFSTDAGAPKTLLITSTRAAEGKSSTTLALSQNFARLGNRVLLIDGDLRKPAFKTGSEPTEGLSRLLTNRDDLSAHVLKTQYENLWLVPCGPLPPNPAELLASPRLKAILNDAAGQFDMVIVDGPPVLGLADAPLLGAACKGTLLVIEAGKTRTQAAMDAVNRLRASGSHIVGAALTKYRARVGSYGYDYEPYRYGGDIEENREREIQLIAHREA